MLIINDNRLADGVLIREDINGFYLEAGVGFVVGYVVFVNDILKVSLNVAVRVAEQIFNGGLAGVERPDDIRAFIKSKMYEPVYTRF